VADIDIRMATETDLDGLTESSNALIGEDALARDPRTHGAGQHARRAGAGRCGFTPLDVTLTARL
jgi:hypothetical protein